MKIFVLRLFLASIAVFIGACSGSSAIGGGSSTSAMNIPNISCNNDACIE